MDYLIYHLKNRGTPFVVRRWIGQMDSNGIHCRGQSLEEVRSQLPPGLRQLPLSPNDPEVIVEAWTDDID